MIEGYVKFSCTWHKAPISVPDETYGQIEKWRATLYKLGLVGAYPDGIGYGNISVCLDEVPRFVITGSATGSLPALEKSHYSVVETFDIKDNSLTCTGETKASSESLTHAAVYTALKNRTGTSVIHIHAKELWNEHKDSLPTTSPEAEYGTPEMARAVGRLVTDSPAGSSGIIVMGGHEDGIVIYGNGIDTAGEKVLALAKGAL